MARKVSPSSLIHCAECGEDYSATYKRCPFCGAKNAPQQPSSDLDDTYVFDGQELFDGDGEEDYTPANSRGGKRLAEKPLSNPFANADINWPRMITFVCSLIIIVAAMIIVFTVIYPQLRGNPTANGSQSPSSPSTDPGSEASQTVGPDSSEPVPDNSDPVTEPPASLPPSASAGLLSISFQRARDVDFTLQAGGTHTITLAFTPADWSGPVTWTSDNTNIATVDANGKVTNVNTTGGLRRAIITATADGLSLQSTVYCVSGPSTGTPPSTNPPATDPPATQAPATNPPTTQAPSTDPPTTQAPSSSSGVTVGKRGVIANTGAGRGVGVVVRSTPNKASNNGIASLFNGDAITVLEDAGNGWYKISFAGINGPAEGYIMGDYISTD